MYLASLTIFSSAYSQSDFIGKMIFLSLFALSIICWIVLGYKWKATRHVQKLSLSFETRFEQNKERLLSYETQDPLSHPFQELFFAVQGKTVEVLNRNLFFVRQTQPESSEVFLSSNDLELLETCGLTVISKENKRLEKDLFILSTIVTLAPFLGLLGTVWGILITFGELTRGGAVHSNSLILGGLSTALATTVLGLVIAIPALIGYQYLKTRVKKMTSDTEDFLYSILSTIELQYRR